LSACAPTAVFQIPLVRLNRALVPSAVFPFAYPPSGAGTTACALGESAKQMSVNTTNNLKIFII
jgi:hypothetical protein